MFKGKIPHTTHHARRTALIVLGVTLLFVCSVRTAVAFNLLKPMANITTSLGGYWKLNNSTVDSSGNGLTLTPTSVTGAAGIQGAANTAYSFNGTSSKIEIPDSTLINTASTYTEKSVSLWFKATDVTARHAIWEEGDLNNGIGMYLETGCFYISAYGNSGSAWTSISSKCSITTNAWHSVVFTIKSASTAVLYVDGVVVNECTNKCGTPGTFAAHPGVTALGAAVGNFNFLGSGTSGGASGTAGAGLYFFSGSIAEVRTYNRQLTAGEAASIVNYQPSQVKLGVGLNRLVGDWQFNGNAKDATPYANNGTVNSASLGADRSGRTSSAYTFAGTTGSYIAVPAASTSSLNVTGTALSVGAWVSMSASNSNTKGVVSRWRDGIAHHYSLQVTSANTVAFRVDNDSNSASIGEVTSSASLSTGTWYHLMGTYDGTTLRIYVNGVLSGSSGWTAAVQSGNEDVNIGRKADASGFPGSIDGVRIYNRTLSAAEITTQYNQYDGSIRYSDLMRGQVADWNLDAQAKDATPYGNHGTVTSGLVGPDRKATSNAAYVFDGVANRYISIPNSASLQLNTDMTISVWYKSGLGTVSDRVLVSKGGANEFELGADSFTGGQKVYWRSAGSTGVQFTSAITSNTAYIHLVATVSGTTLTLYKDGSSFGTTTISSRSTSANVVNIGRRIDGTMLAAGTLDEVRLWNRALSAAEVSTLSKTYR